MNLLRITFTCMLLIIGALLFNGYSQTSKSAIDFGDISIPPFEYTQYIVKSTWKNDREANIESFYKKLNGKGGTYKKMEGHKIRVGPKQQEINPHFKMYHYTNEDSWVDVMLGVSPDSLQKEWIKLRNDLRPWFGSNNQEVFAYLNFKTKKNSSINILGRTGTDIINFGFELPFMIPETYYDLTYEQQLIIEEKGVKLTKMLELFAETVVDPDEWMGKPITSRRMSAAERQYGFVQFWTEVKYNFAFFDQVPNLDWDRVLYDYLPKVQQDQSNEDYYRLMAEVCAKLEDGHTNIYPPMSLAFQSDAPPIRLRNFGKKAYVVDIVKELASQIPLGAEVVSVDQIPTEKYLKDNIFPYLSSSTEHILYDWGIRDLLEGDKTTSVDIEIRKPDGSKSSVNLPRDQSQYTRDWIKGREGWRLSEFKRLKDDIAYVSLNSFSNKNIVEAFESYIDSIQSCKGVIIDLRKNGGGSSGNGYEIISYFTDKPFRGSSWRTREHRASFKAWGSFIAEQADNTLDEWSIRAKRTYEGNYWHISEADTIFPDKPLKIELPLVVLIGHNTASAAEDFLVALDQTGLAPTIGEPTFGSTGQPLSIPMPGGGSARICTKKDTYPDGREFVGYGVQPEIHIPITIEDYLSEKDAALERGIDYLKERMKE